DGRGFAVGRWVDEEGRRIGFSGFIGGTAAQASSSMAAPRAPDASASKLADLPKASDGALRLPDAALSNGASYSGGELSEGAEINLAFSLPTTRTIRISARARGDVDFVLLDARK